MGRINLKDPATLADFAASMTTASGKELQEILETMSIKERIEKALNLLRHELEVAKLQVKISQRVEDRMSQQQREFFLREQLKEIKKELGITKEGSESETEKVLKKVNQFFDNDWQEYQSKVEDANLSFFKSYKPIKIE